MEQLTTGRISLRRTGTYAGAPVAGFVTALHMPRVPLFAYHTGLGIYAYLALGALALGTFRLASHAAPHIRDGSRRQWLQHLKETNS